MLTLLASCLASLANIHRKFSCVRNSAVHAFNKSLFFACLLKIAGESVLLVAYIKFFLHQELKSLMIH